MEICVELKYGTRMQLVRRAFRDWREVLTEISEYYNITWFDSSPRGDELVIDYNQVLGFFYSKFKLHSPFTRAEMIDGCTKLSHTARISILIWTDVNHARIAREFGSFGDLVEKRVGRVISVYSACGLIGSLMRASMIVFFGSKVSLGIYVYIRTHFNSQSN